MVHSLRTVTREILRSFVNVISHAAVLLTCLNSYALDKQKDELIPPAPSGGMSSSESAQISKMEELWTDKPLSTLKASVEPTEGELPPKIPVVQQLEQDNQGRSIDLPRPWYFTDCEWDAPATMNLPLFFEEPNLERLGYTYRYCCKDCFSYWCEDDEDECYASECMQPLISGVHFFGRIPLLPYMLFQQPLCEPIFTLGVDRPGSPVDYRSYHLLNFESVWRTTGRAHQRTRARIHAHDQYVFGWGNESMLAEIGRSHQRTRARIHAHDQYVFGRLLNGHFGFGGNQEDEASCEPQEEGK